MANRGNALLWVCVWLVSLAVIYRQPAPPRQAEAVGRTPIFVEEYLQNSPLATTL